MRSEGHAKNLAAQVPPWSRPGEAIRLFIHGVTVRRCVPVAAVVGCVLFSINQAVPVATGRTGWLTWVQIGLNFLVPFLVASYGYLASARVPA
jgi:hypothetical protein